MSRWAVVLAITLLALLRGSGLGEGMITVCPSGCDYAEVQQAIDGARPGEAVQIEPGTYEGNLVIGKSLTLQGTDRERTIIRGVEKGEPVILIEDGPAAGEPPEVRIAGLTITGGQAYCRYWPVCADGILVRGRARVTIIDNIISGNGWGGIAVRDEAQVTIEGNLFSANRRSHIGLWDSSSATIQENRLLQNGDDGIVLWGAAQATIEGNRISGGLYGIKLREFAQATIDANVIMDNSWDGLELRDSTQASIAHNQFSANGGDGVVVWRSAQATLANNTITENRNGVLLGRALQGETTSETLLKLWGNNVFDNSGWGVAVYTVACGFAGAPQVLGGTIQGSANKIHDNGRGDLCPEDYPWPEGFTEELG